MSRLDPLVFVHHMLENRSSRDLDTDRMLNLAVVRLMEIVGEASMGLTEDFRSRYPHVQWRETSDNGNKLIHAYDEIDFDILWDFIRNEIPPLIAQLDAISAEHERPAT
jgi:uncharacterized protein with HEPN domain